MSTQILTVHLPGVPYFIEGEAARVLNTLCQQYAHLALQTIAGYVSDAAPVNTGALGQSFLADPASGSGGIEVFGDIVTNDLHGRVFSSLPYSAVMEEGRAPGTMPPVDAIKLWVRRQLGETDEDAIDSAAWAIAISIKRKGIVGRHYAQAGLSAAQGPVQAIFDTLGEAVVTAWGTPQ